MKVKQQLYYQCETFIENRLITIQKSIIEIQVALSTETKSSVGDKHETGRAMLQIEREKIGQQLAETQKLKEALSKIDIEKSRKIVSLGSLVITTKSNYFLAISAGKIQIQNEFFYAISMSTPIAQLLIGKSVGDTIAFREQTFSITEIN